MAATYAGVFPGHGRIPAGRLLAWRETDQAHVFATVAAAAGLPVDQLLDPGPGPAVEVADAAVLAASVAASAATVHRAPGPGLLAGHDVGEVAAAVAAGALTLADGARFVVERARAVHRAAELSHDGRVTVDGLAPDTLAVLQAHLPVDVTLAEVDRPDHLVLTGPVRQVRLAAMRAEGLGAAVTLMAGDAGLHSPAMTPAMVELRGLLNRCEVAAPRRTLVEPATGRELTDADDVRRSLAEGVLAPVRWDSVAAELVARGVGLVVQFGPGSLHACATAADVESVVADTPDAVRRVVRRITAG